MKKGKSIFWRTMAFVMPYKFLFAARLALTILNSISGLISNYGAAMIVKAETELDLKLLYIAITILVFCLIWEGISTVVSAMLMSRVSFRSIRDIKNHLIRHFQQLPQRFYDNNHSGDLSSRMTNDLSVVQSFISDRLTIYLYYPTRFLAAFLFMLFMSWKLLLVSCIIIPITIYLPKLIAKHIEVEAMRLQKGLGKTTTLLQDTLGGIEIVKAFNLQETLDKSFDKTNQEALNNDLKLNKLHLLNYYFSEIAYLGPTLICSFYGVYLAIAGQIQLYQLTFFIFSMNYLAEPLANIPYMLEAWKRTEGASKRLLELMDSPAEKSGEEKDPKAMEKYPICVKDMSFGYYEEDLIDQVSFTAELGQITAFVGPSGCGKSTLFKLMCGFYDNYRGSIRIIGHELKDWDLRELRKHLSIVSQDALLFPSTIYENIAMGKEGATREEIIDAAKKANAHDFILELENGYDTYVGERGAKLSGGQKQRITIARAMLKNAPILFLDEPTSALDLHSEALVQKAIERMVYGKTVFIIAHRLSTIKNAHKLIVLQNGTVEAIGTHTELLQRSSLYQSLYQKEAKMFKGEYGDVT